MAQNNSYTLDAVTVLKDNLAVVGASAAGTVATVARVIEVGAAYVEGVAIIDVSAIEAATDEVYTIIIQGAAVVAFTTPVPLAALQVGHTSVILGGGPTSTVGRYYVRFQNEQNGVIYPFIRIYTNVTGTIASGISYGAWIGKTGSDS